MLNKRDCRRRVFLCAAVWAFVAPFAAAAADAPDFSLAKVYRENADLRGYFASEKLDGVRAFWDGEKFISRRGNIFAAPEWFTAGFPKTPLDGELWSKRGDFENISGIVRRAKPHEGWRKIKYMVFDMPRESGAFRIRLQTMRETVAAANLPHLQTVPQWEINGAEALRAKLEEITAAGGEGIMLRRKDSPHRGGRNDDLLKLKPFADAEATVVAHRPGKGKFSGMLGSLLVETETGIRFGIGSGFTLAERKSPPPIGSRITYKHSGFTNTGKPRFAVFLRVRKDEPGE